MSRAPSHCDPVPPELRAQADAAEARKEAALGRLEMLLAEPVDQTVGHEPDEFDLAMRILVDADKAAVKAVGR